MKTQIENKKEEEKKEIMKQTEERMRTDIQLYKKRRIEQEICRLSTRTSQLAKEHC